MQNNAPRCVPSLSSCNSSCSVFSCTFNWGTTQSTNRIQLLRRTEENEHCRKESYAGPPCDPIKLLHHQVSFSHSHYFVHLPSSADHTYCSSPHLPFSHVQWGSSTCAGLHNNSTKNLYQCDHAHRKGISAPIIECYFPQSYCKLIIFGLVPQYLYLSQINAGGTTIFLGDDVHKMSTINANSNSTWTYKVEYQIPGNKAYKLLKHVMQNPACGPSSGLLRESQCQLALTT